MKSSHMVVFVMTFLVAGIFTSCSMDSGDSTDHSGIVNSQTGEAEWTVMYYGAGNYAEDLADGGSLTIHTLQGMENVINSPHVNTVALIGCAETDGHSLFYEVNQASDKDGRGIQSTLLADWGVRNMSSAQLIAQFADTVARLYPAKKYMLIVSGDGRGWMGACRDDEGGHSGIMPVTDMQSELAAVTGADGNPLQIDLLYWMVPNMGMLEVAYEMKNLVHYMVSGATKTTVDHYRMMEYWLRDLHGAPETDPLELGRLVLRSVNQSGEALHSRVEMSLLDLDHVVASAQSMDALSARLSNEMETHSDVLRGIRDAAWSGDLDDTLIVDIEALLNAIADQPELSELEGMQALTDNVRSSLNALRVERLDTRELNGRFGITIHFPPFAQQLNLAEYDRLRITADYSRWATFISAVAPHYTEPAELSGLVRNSLRQQLVNVGVFLLAGDTWDEIVAQSHADIVYLNAIGDSANFAAVLSLPDSSITARFGMFTDADSNGFDQGDKFGFGSWTNGQQWQTLTAGSEFASLFCNVNNVRN